MRSLQEKVGRVVQRLRKEKGYSQEAFAVVVGVHRTYMGLIERGQANVTLETLNKVARALSINSSEVIRRAESEK